MREGRLGDLKKLGAAIFGAGWVAVEHLRAYAANPNCEVVAVGSRRAESARRVAAEAGVGDATIYTDFDQLLADERVNVLSITTPHDSHADLTIRAARAGKHILLEKPICMRYEDMEPMRRAVEEAGVKTLVGFVLHWNPLFENIKALVASGAIGEIVYAEVDYWHGIKREYPCYPWQITKEQGGTSLLAAGCHAVDAFRYLSGLEAAEVTAYSTPHRRDEAFGYDPTIVAAVKFENGSIGKFSSSLDCVMPYRFNIDLLGSEGTLRDNLLYSRKLLPGQTNFAQVPTILPDSGDVSHHPFTGEIAHLIDGILHDRPICPDLHDAIKTHELIFAADRSAEEGRPIRLPMTTNDK